MTTVKRKNGSRCSGGAPLLGEAVDGQNCTWVDRPYTHKRSSHMSSMSMTVNWYVLVMDILNISRELCGEYEETKKRRKKLREKGC